MSPRPVTARAQLKREIQDDLVDVIALVKDDLKEGLDERLDYKLSAFRNEMRLLLFASVMLNQALFKVDLPSEITVGAVALVVAKVGWSITASRFSS